MGATNFSTHVRVAKTVSTEDAFRDTREGAQFEYGHGGYTGSMAEKNSLTVLATVATKEQADLIEYGIMHADPLPIYSEQAVESLTDKWGPANAVRYSIDKTTDGILFFGFASC